MSKGEDPFLDYETVTAFSDMIHVDHENVLEPFREFEYIYRYYPDAYYILNTRNAFDWVRSRKNHGTLYERYKSALGCNTDSEVVERWMMDWYAHHHECVGFFSGNQKFMIYDVDRMKPEDIAAFLSDDFPRLDVSLFPHRNKSKRPLLARIKGG